ncbi:MAG: NAD(P)/FAD-dependent oxidoreductase [Lachnospiraceae bacterium]|nr:NAD(P)/FAD-dependent oxidoreductase [Lachnospiraceae bacterium]
MKYDVAIVGTGPAGLSAALNLKLHNKKVAWFGADGLSMKIQKAKKIANYPGVPMVSGRDLNQCFREQIKEAQIEILDKMVTSIVAGRNGYMIQAGEDIYYAKVVLLATGTVSSKVISGEEELLGKGVSYCATCDGFLYKDKTIAVFCENRKFENEVTYLAEIAKTVYLFTDYKDCKLNLPNVIQFDGKIGEIVGREKAVGVQLTDGFKIETDGVFIFRTTLAASTVVNGLKMEGPHIIVDRQMKTNKNGVYAAGDCTGMPYQIAKAVGEGNIAAHAIIKYLQIMS